MNARADRFKTASPTNSSTNRTSKPTRCAIYTRKSTSEGLNADFNTLDAQREAAEHYILAMKREGWEALPAHYDDGGFTGANTERPALKRLLTDIEAGEVDCVVVYKVDRLSRSIGDFADWPRLPEKISRICEDILSLTWICPSRTRRIASINLSPPSCFMT